MLFCQEKVDLVLPKTGPKGRRRRRRVDGHLERAGDEDGDGKQARRQGLGTLHHRAHCELA